MASSTKDSVIESENTLQLDSSIKQVHKMEISNEHDIENDSSESLVTTIEEVLGEDPETEVNQDEDQIPSNNLKSSGASGNIIEQLEDGIETSSNPSLILSSSNITKGDSSVSDKDFSADLLEITDADQSACDQEKILVGNGATTVVKSSGKDIASMAVAAADNDDDAKMKMTSKDSVTGNEAENSKTEPVKNIEKSADGSVLADVKTSSDPASKEASESGKSSKGSPKQTVGKNLLRDSPKNASKTPTKSPQVKKTKSVTEGPLEKDADGKVRRISPSDKTLWVSNLSNKTRAADLKALFSKHGKVSTAKILTNSKTPGARCYGLISLVTSKDSTSCISKLHHTELHGRVISVEKTNQALKKQPVSAPEITIVKDEGTKEGNGEVRRSTETKTVPEVPAKATHQESKKSPDKASIEDPKKRSRVSSRDRSRTKSVSSHGNGRRSRSRKRDRLPVFRRFRRSRSRSPLQRHFDHPERRDRYGNPIISMTMKRLDTYDNRRSDFDRFRDDSDRDMERTNRHETMRLERERERLKMEREKLEREKAKLLIMEKEQQRLERFKLEQEMAEVRKYSMLLSMKDSKHMMSRANIWGDSKHSLSRTADPTRRDTINRYYASAERPYHPATGAEGSDHSAAAWSTNPDPSKYNRQPVGVWARMDVPPPTATHHWGTMDPASQPTVMSHQQASHSGMVEPSGQVVMFVGDTSHSADPASAGQYSSSRYSTNMRRF